MFFQAGSHAEKFILLLTAKRYHIHHRRPCLGESSGLIKDDGFCFRHGFHGFTALDRNFIAAGLPDGRQHGNRHGQFQRAGEIYHEHRKSLCGISCQQISKPCTQQGIWNQLVARCSALLSSADFNCSDSLNHGNDFLKTAGTVDFFYLESQFSFFHHCCRHKHSRPRICGPAALLR